MFYFAELQFQDFATVSRIFFLIRSIKETWAEESYLNIRPGELYVRMKQMRSWNVQWT